MQSADPLKSLASALRKAKHVLIATHVNPDGDAVGSASALAHIALRLGGEARIFLQSGMPGYLSWLPLPVPVVENLAALSSWTPDLLLACDCGDARRAGPELEPHLSGLGTTDRKWPGLVTANIDHHVSNPGFADINWVEPQRAATGELVGLLAEHLGLSLDGDLGQAVYLALVSDTGNFTFSNTSPGAFGMAARIAASGLDVAEFTNKHENIWTLNRMHLWGRLFSEVRLHAGGAVASAVVHREYLDVLGLDNEDLEGFASWLRRLRGVRVGLFVREDTPGVSKISLRSMGDVNVQAVCAVFGGGGHAAAAGAEVGLGPEEAVQAVLAEIMKQL